MLKEHMLCQVSLSYLERAMFLYSSTVLLNMLTDFELEEKKFFLVNSP